MHSQNIIVACYERPAWWKLTVSRLKHFHPNLIIKCNNGYVKNFKDQNFGNTSWDLQSARGIHTVGPACDHVLLFLLFQLATKAVPCYATLLRPQTCNSYSRRHGGTW
jgi:hypothetical protein